MDFLDDLDVVCPTPPVHNPVDGGAVKKPAARHRPSKKLKTQDGTSTSRAPPLLAEDDARLERNKGQGQNKPVRLGTMFSGLETPSIALKLRLGSKQHELAFAIEKEKPLRDLIQLAWNPKQLHSDITDVDFTTLPDCDLLVAGPPCPSFSPAGKLGGDTDCRGRLVYKVNEYVNDRASLHLPLPRAIVLENSKLLLSKFRSVYKRIKSGFKKHGYTVQKAVLDSQMNGVPQSRQRTYIVAYMPVHGRDFIFPENLPEPIPLQKVLDPPPPECVPLLPPAPIKCLQTDTARRNYKSAKAYAKKNGLNLKTTPLFVDINAGKQFMQAVANICPTITRTRAKAGGFYISPLQRRTRTSEMLRLQGCHFRVSSTSAA